MSGKFSVFISKVVVVLAVIGDKPHSSVICCLKQKCLFDTEFVFGFGVWQVGSSMLLCVVVEAGDGVGIMSDGNVAAHKSQFC